MAELARPDDAAEPSASAPVDAPAPAAPAGGDDFDSTIREFERATAPQPAAQPEQPQAAPDDIDKLLAELSRPGPVDGGALDGSPRTELDQALADLDRTAAMQQARQHIAGVEAQNQQLRAHLQRAADQRDFDKLATEVQSKLPDHLPKDYARSALIAMAAEKPALAAAFDLRNITDRRAVDLELRKAETILQQLGRDPSADPQRVAQLTEYSYRLGLALNAPEIIRRAKLEVLKRGQAHRPIDPEATAEHDAVRFAVMGASGKAPAERAPDLGGLSDKEFARYTRQTYGF
jgi:hypothetical protein